MIRFIPQQEHRHYSKPTDMRKSFGGLCGIVRNELNRDAVSAEVLLFPKKIETELLAKGKISIPTSGLKAPS